MGSVSSSILNEVTKDLFLSSLLLCDKPQDGSWRKTRGSTILLQRNLRLSSCLKKHTGCMGLCPVANNAGHILRKRGCFGSQFWSKVEGQYLVMVFFASRILRQRRPSHGKRQGLGCVDGYVLWSPLLMKPADSVMGALPLRILTSSQRPLLCFNAIVGSSFCLLKALRWGLSFNTWYLGNKTDYQAIIKLYPRHLQVIPVLFCFLLLLFVCLFCGGAGNQT
jgi:hypothetical protein